MGTRWWEGKKNNRPWIILTLADLRCWGATVKKKNNFYSTRVMGTFVCTVTAT